MTPAELQAAIRTRNREAQRVLRERRRNSQTRLTVWLPQIAAHDFRYLAEALRMTHSELLTAMIRHTMDEYHPQTRLD